MCAHVTSETSWQELDFLLPLCGFWEETQLLGLVAGTDTHLATLLACKVTWKKETTERQEVVVEEAL